MRGRTNASNGGIFLNATTDDFEVATGNSIVAGDFVEYHYDTVEKDLTGSIILNSKNYLVDSTTGLYIALINSIPTLFVYNGSEIEVVETYTYNASTLFQYSQTIYFADGKILEIDVQNQTFTLIATTSVIPDAKIGNNILIYRSGTKLYTCNCADLTNITVLQNVSMGSETYYFLCVRGNTAYYVYGSTGSYGRYYMTPYTINTTTGAITSGTNIQIDTTGSSSSASTNRTAILTTKLINDRFAIFAEAFASYTSAPFYIVIYDFEQNSVIYKNTLSVGTSTSKGLLFASDINAYNEILIGEEVSGAGTYKGVALFRFDPTNLTFSKVDSYDLSENYYAIFVKNRNIFTIHRSNKYLPAEIKNDKIEIGGVTDTVQEWAGSGNPMGVAKQSGTAGDTIEVYIPQVNS